MKGILGKKLGMTRIYNAEGHSIPVTVIKAGPCTVTALRTVEKHGYEAIQISFEPVPKGRWVSKPITGQFVKKDLQVHRYLREIRGISPTNYRVGQEILVDIFKEGEKVDIIGTSIGKGFAGAVKRYHFSGGGASHGSMFHRSPCTNGGTDAARTFKAKRGPGQMGAVRRTVQNLEIIKIDKDRNLLLIKGAVPGARNSFLMIHNTVKVRKKRKPRILGTQTK